MLVRYERFIASAIRRTTSTFSRDIAREYPRST
jgi:hypothetical protein